MTNICAWLRGLWADESGISFVEYVLLLAIVVGAIVAAAGELADAVTNEMQNTAACTPTEGGDCQ